MFYGFVGLVLVVTITLTTAACPSGSFLNSTTQHCQCSNAEVYDTKNNACGCTSKLTSVDADGKCEPGNSVVSCTLTGIGYTCGCQPGGYFTNDKCYCSDRTQYIDTTGKCSCIYSMIPTPDGPTNCGCPKYSTLVGDIYCNPAEGAKLTVDKSAYECGSTENPMIQFELLGNLKLYRCQCPYGVSFNGTTGECDCPVGTMWNNYSTKCEIPFEADCNPVDSVGPQCAENGYCQRQNASTGKCACRSGAAYDNTTQECQCTEGTAAYSFLNYGPVCNLGTGVSCSLVGSDVSWSCNCPSGTTFVPKSTGSSINSGERYRCGSLVWKLLKEFGSALGLQQNPYSAGNQCLPIPTDDYSPGACTCSGDLVLDQYSCVCPANQLLATNNTTKCACPTYSRKRQTDSKVCVCPTGAEMSSDGTMCLCTDQKQKMNDNGICVCKRGISILGLINLCF